MNKFELRLKAYYGGDENAYEELQRILKKEKRIKTFVAVACLFIMAFTIVAVVLFKSYDNKIRNYCELELSQDKTHYVVTGYKGDDTQVIIPSVYRGKPIKSIAYEAFANNNAIEIVIIPDSVTTIEDNAFAGCTSLVEVQIPSSVTSIGDYTFSNCSSLVVITLPDSVTTIEDNAFAGCTSLIDILIPPSVISIGDYAFFNCSSLVAITLPNSVSSIGSFAFGDCDSIYKIEFEGTSDQWETMNKAENWIGDKGFYVVYCYNAIIFHSD